MLDNSRGNHRWYVLVLVALTSAVCNAMPLMCMPVLFKEISEDLGLSLVQLGWVWGILPLAGLFTVFIGGLLADRFGARRTLIIACLLGGLSGALRGFSTDFPGLVLTSCFFGVVLSFIPASIIKSVATHFQGRQLGFANGVIATGVGAGFTIAALISATFMSPWLGGWRNVLFFYGALSILCSLLWLLTVREHKPVYQGDSAENISLGKAISHVMRQKSVWIMGLALLGYAGCIDGMTGYLPIYLRDSGWIAANADGTLAAFNGLSTAFAIPIAMLSDRLDMRKGLVMLILAATVIGIAMLSIADGWAIWVIVIIAGMARDGLMAISMTMNIESKGVGAMYAGTAVGLVQTMIRVGRFFSPPLGNSLASAHPGLPFVVWAAFGLAGFLSFSFLKDTRRK